MTHRRESRREAAMPNPLLTPKTTTLFGTWNVRTMYEAGKAAQIAAEMTTYNLSILGLCETRWIESGCIRLSTGQTVLYSGHEDSNAPHTEGVGFMLTPQAAKSLIGWNPVSSRIITARFHTKIGKATLIQCYAPTNEADDEVKTDFYERLQGVIDRIARKDLILLLGDFNAKVGSNNTSFETVMGKHGIGEMNENGELFADFCSFNKLVIGGSVFPHKRVHKATWVSPDGRTENQIDHICISSKFRRSLLDVRAKREADVASDHHLLVGKCRLKLKRYNTGMQKISHKYNIRMLKDDGIKNRFQLTISNKYQVLASLQENEEHREERDNQRTVNEMWQGMKNAWKETCEETLGRERKQHKTFLSLDTLKKIEARKKAKETLNHSRTRAKTTEARIRYSEVNKEVKRSIRNDRRNFVEDLARQAEEASGRGDAKELYSITKKLAGDRKIPDRPVKDKSGELLTDQEEQRKRWAEHFKELLNRPPPSEMPHMQPADTPLQVSENKPNEAEIKRAIRQLKNGKAAGPDGIPSEAIKADINTSTKMLYELFGKIWETNEIPDDWKEGCLIKLPKKGDLKECKNWRGIMLLSTAGKVLNRVILERLKEEVDKRLREEQAGFRKDRSCTDQIATLRIILEQSLEWNSPVYTTFVDYEKAFDSVDREVLWKLLRHYGIPDKYITLIQKTYEKCTCRVIHNGVLSELFEMLTGVRQGCLLSPFLFLLVIDWIMRGTTEQHPDGIQWTLTTRLEDLDFADDIALLSHNHRSMQSKLTRLAKISMQTGLRISKSKTKVMRVNTRNVDRIELAEDEIDEVEDFAYLGSNISKDGGSDQDIRVRIGKARTAFTILTPVWRSKVISRKTKLRIFNTNVKSVLLYGSETWRVTKANSTKLQTFINKCLRSIMGIHCPEVITNEELWTTTEQERINIQIRRRTWGWIGHTLRKPNCNVTKQALRWNPQGKRSRGRPRNSWRRTVDNEAKNAGYTWWQLEKLAKNRSRWRAIVSEDLCSTRSERV